MGVKPDSWIRERALAGMIEPFVACQVTSQQEARIVPVGPTFPTFAALDMEERPVISYGLSSYGYDMRVTRTFRVFSPVHCQVLDVKDFPLAAYQEVEAGTVLIPPNSFALGSSVERFRIPRDVLALCVGKSSYARMGIIINVTPLEPEWEGHVTIEISNTAPLPARVYANEGIAQVIFLGADLEIEPGFDRNGVVNPSWRGQCEVSYADRKGKYQGQTGITLPRV